jgi:hypothetical protein
MMQIRIKEITVIDWYDGEVTAFLDTGDGWMFAVMVACDLGARRRVYLITPLSDDEHAAIGAAAQAWAASGKEAYVAAVHRVLSNPGAVYRYDGWLERSQELRLVRIDDFRRPHMATADIEVAITEASIATWT